MKKAKIGMITGILLTIIGIVVGFNVVGQSSTVLTTASDSIVDANNCSEYEDDQGTDFTYNSTSRDCYNWNSSYTPLAYQYDLPLNTFFSSSGILLIILMAMLFLGMMGYIIVRVRK